MGRIWIMIDEIDWNKLKPYKNSKNKSFEELCYQIAKRLDEGKGKFTSIDDSGGGDGVEFYLTLPNGDQWGWQAKFYHSNDRLSQSNRKKSIINSFKRACEIHPHLKKWVLCTAINFTTDEQDWFDSELPNSIPEDMSVEIEHCGDSQFNSYFSDPKFKGLPDYFFCQLELELEWFKSQFDKQMAGVSDKFDSSLHTETRVDAEVHALLGDKAFVQQITDWIEKLEEELSDLKEATNKLNSPIPYIEWNGKEKSKVIKAAELLQDSLLNINIQLKQTGDLLVEKDLSKAQPIDCKSALDLLYETIDTYRKVVRESGTTKMKCTTEKQYEDQVLNYASSIVHGPDNLVARLLDEFFPSVIWQLGLINESDLHILGEAGIGKTHIACNICADRLKNGLPALFVRGSQFRTDQAIEVQLRELFDIPSAHSWQDFLQALSAAAEAYRTRIPLIIDGLNESVHNGTFSKVWELGLTGLVQEIKQTKNVVLITTCRRSYEEAIWKEVIPNENIIQGKTIWKDKDSQNLVYSYGFCTNEVTQEAIEKYFNAYKIKADLTFAPLSYFRIPIYLKIFCETKNRERKVEKQVYVGEQTMFDVFDEYLVQCNEAVCKLLDLDSGVCIVQSALIKMAIYLWKNNDRHIPRDELARIIDGESLDKQKKSSSKMFALESESLLLVFRDMIDRTEVMRFTYDLLGGYLIAQYLVEQASNRRKIILQRVVSKLFGKDKRAFNAFLNRIKNIAISLFPKKFRQYIDTLEKNKTEHPMYDDIGRCLAALLPTRTGSYLHQLSNNEKAFGFSIRSLFEISTDDINDECINLVEDLFALPENRDIFFNLAETTVGHPEHPFNAKFWSKQLSTLSMQERDLSWTEYVRKNRYSFEEMLIRFEETCKKHQDISDLSAKRLHLLAEHIMWILTSTVRPLRDIATRALYWYGRRFSNEFFDLVLKSFTINDPYVSERMLAASYGIAMARQNDFDDNIFVNKMLPKYAKQLYENMFKPNATHATTHILARDYAKRTIDIALIHQPDLLTDDEKVRIKPPYTDGGIHKWGESENKNDGEYEKGPAPLQMDFENYTLGALIKSDSTNPEEYKSIKANIYWRIYDLGFSLERFGEIDSLLLTENYRKYSRSGDGRKTDRYGKKYSWIAYFELAGYRQDQGILPDFYDHGRCIEADIDPSFPEEHRKYNLVTEDFLGDRDASTEQWVLKTPHPDLRPYLNVDQFCEEQGSWVLLYGHLGQKDKHVCRKMSAWVQGLIVKPEDLNEILEILNRQELIDGNTVPFIPEDYKTYAGEIPWCDTYPPNDWREFSFIVRKYTIPKKQFELLRCGTPISPIDDFQLWDTARKLIENDDEKKLNELLNEKNLEITIKTVDEEKLEHKNFEVLVPVRDSCWEVSNSAANPSRSIAVPTSEISDCLNLYKRPQCFDFFEKDSNSRASISFEYGDIWSNPQSFTYLRKDLLERFLADIGGELIWVIWGNRLLVTENYDGAYKTFQEVKTYSDIQK